MSFNVFCLTFYKDHTGTAAVPMISKKNRHAEINLRAVEWSCAFSTTDISAFSDPWLPGRSRRTLLHESRSWSCQRKMLHIHVIQSTRNRVLASMHETEYQQTTTRSSTRVLQTGAIFTKYLTIYRLRLSELIVRSTYDGDLQRAEISIGREYRIVNLRTLSDDLIRFCEWNVLYAGRLFHTRRNQFQQLLTDGHRMKKMLLHCIGCRCTLKRDVGHYLVVCQLRWATVINATMSVLLPLYLIPDCQFF